MLCDLVGCFNADFIQFDCPDAFIIVVTCSLDKSLFLKNLAGFAQVTWIDIQLFS